MPSMPWYDPVLAPACAAAEAVHASPKPSSGLQQGPGAWKADDLMSGAKPDVAVSVAASTHCQVCTSALCACMQDDPCLWVLLDQRPCDTQVKHLATCRCCFGEGYQCSAGRHVCVCVGEGVRADVYLASNLGMVMWSALLVTW